MKTCPDCGLPNPGTGELFILTGWKPGKAWRTRTPPSLHIDPTGEADIVGGDDAVLVDTQVPDVSRTCQCKSPWDGA